jgi:hypothetical protein
MKEFLAKPKKVCYCHQNVLTLIYLYGLRWSGFVSYYKTVHLYMLTVIISIPTVKFSI